MHILYSSLLLASAVTAVAAEDSPFSLYSLLSHTPSGRSGRGQQHIPQKSITFNVTDNTDYHTTKCHISWDWREPAPTNWISCNDDNFLFRIQNYTQIRQFDLDVAHYDGQRVNGTCLDSDGSCDLHLGTVSMTNFVDWRTRCGGSGVCNAFAAGPVETQSSDTLSGPDSDDNDDSSVGSDS